MFRLKICGVRRPEDIALVADAGGDAVGFNFHPPSVRYLTPTTACELARLAGELGLTRVGVFVDQTLAQIAHIAASTPLDVCQLHGQQTVADACFLRDQRLQVIGVVRLPSGPLEPEQIQQLVAAWQAEQIAVLLDADVGAAAGGMGMRLDWPAIGEWQRQYRPPAGWSWALAGGLTPDTVATAIAQSVAVAVDVASGVEQPRGVKSAERIAAFAAAAQAAWQAGR